MKGYVKEPFVDPVRLLYLPAGVEIEVPEDRVAELSRWMEFYDKKATEEAPKEAPKPKRAPRKKKQ